MAGNELCLDELPLSGRIVHKATSLHPYRTYIALFDKPAQGDNDDADGANSGLSALERKKLRAKQRKAEAKAKKVW